MEMMGLGVRCGIWRIVNAYKLALSKTRIYCAAGIRTSVTVQPPLRAHYLRTASRAGCRGARDCAIVGCAGTQQFLQGNINETSCWQPWSAWAQKQARGCIQWQSAGLADSNPDLAHGNLISEKPQIFISSSTALSV